MVERTTDKNIKSPVDLTIHRLLYTMYIMYIKLQYAVFVGHVQHGTCTETVQYKGQIDLVCVCYHFSHIRKTGMEKSHHTKLL